MVAYLSVLPVGLLSCPGCTLPLAPTMPQLTKRLSSAHSYMFSPQMDDTHTLSTGLLQYKSRYLQS